MSVGATPSVERDALLAGDASLQISLTGPQVERAIVALESIAASLAKIANPLLIARDDGNGGVRVERL